VSDRFVRMAYAAFVLCGGVPTVIRAADSQGEQAFSECAVCHTTDGSPRVGPTLKGVVKYLANPQAVVPGNVMPYAGMSDANQRAAVIAYLATIK